MKAEIILKYYFYFTCNHGISLTFAHYASTEVTVTVICYVSNFLPMSGELTVD